MSRRLDMVLSSIGKKELMALTGLGFVAFLVVHLAGNFTMLAGADAFNAYAAKLASLGPLVLIAEAGMLVTFALHVVFGVALVLRNYRARGTRYNVKKSEGGTSIASWTMWLTGPIILAFVGLHLWHFTVPHKVLDNEAPLTDLVVDVLSNPYWTAYYVVSVFAVGLHVSHGFWSSFQTLGLSTHRRGHLRDSSLLLVFIFAAGYALLAFFVFYIPDLLK